MAEFWCSLGGSCMLLRASWDNQVSLHPMWRFCRAGPAALCLGRRKGCASTPCPVLRAAKPVRVSPYFFSIGLINPGVFFMAEFGPNSPLSNDGCQPAQPAVNWVTMGLLLLPWGQAAEHSDLLVFPGNTCRRKRGQPGANLPRAVAVL